MVQPVVSPIMSFPSEIIPEIARLLAACRFSRNPHLTTIVVLAINTGMRRSEILELEWERIDLFSARITLYETKNEAPRGLQDVRDDVAV